MTSISLGLLGVSLLAATAAHAQSANKAPAAPVEVTIVNPAAVRDLDHSARNAFQFNLCMGSCGGVPSTYELPAGKRAVIEFVTADCNASLTGIVASVVISTQVNGVGVYHLLAPQQTYTTATVKGYAVSQQVRLYAEGQVFGSFATPVVGSVNACRISVSGTLVTL